jgi:type II restriction enzyme
MMNDLVLRAIQSVITSKISFCKFLSANDTGLTGGHQAGIYISKPAVPIMFDEPGIKGENKEKTVKICWHDGSITESHFKYYGQGTRNEYRITSFGRGFPYLNINYTGALFILAQSSCEYYSAYILNTDDEINSFLDTFCMSPADTNKIIDISFASSETIEQLEMKKFIDSLDIDFPTSDVMSKAAREIQNKVYNHNEFIISNPDKKLIDWTEMEFRLFRTLEHERYGKIINSGFSSIDDFIITANIVLNRRKSRAGKSLEHHLSALFEGNGLHFTEQAVTEGNKRPDFIFPSQTAYHDPFYPTEKIISLAAKTTCKDRWRQVINEANRLRGRNKYLCTLQQGISSTQIDEMIAEKVVLVVPQQYINTYPREKRDVIWSLNKFISFVHEIENSP